MLKITAIKYKELFNKSCVSWQSLANSYTRYPIEYKLTKSENGFTQVRYVTLEDIIASMKLKMACSPDNVKRFLPKWKATIRRCTELQDDRVFISTQDS